MGSENLDFMYYMLDLRAPLRYIELGNLWTNVIHEVSSRTPKRSTLLGISRRRLQEEDESIRRVKSSTESLKAGLVTFLN